MRSRCCVCVCVSPPIVASNGSVKSPLIIARQRLGRNVTTVTNIHATIEVLDWSRRVGPCRIKESRRLVLPRTSCYSVIRRNVVRQ
jgi:hypothetical protein